MGAISRWAGGMLGLLYRAVHGMTNFCLSPPQIPTFVFKCYLCYPLNCEYSIWTGYCLIFSPVWDTMLISFEGKLLGMMIMPVFSRRIACCNDSGWVRFTLKMVHPLCSVGENYISSYQGRERERHYLFVLFEISLQACPSGTQQW